MAAGHEGKRASADAGADVAARDCDGYTPLHVLAMESAGWPWAVEVARLLLGGGADAAAVNTAGVTDDEAAANARDQLREVLRAAAAAGEGGA